MIQNGKDNQIVKLSQIQSNWSELILQMYTNRKEKFKLQSENKAKWKQKLVCKWILSRF